jgi:hypothetical protein
MNSYLAKPISLMEVDLVVRSMAKGKSLGLKKIVIKFNTFFGDLIGRFFQNDRGGNQRGIFAQ